MSPHATAVSAATRSRPRRTPRPGGRLLAAVTVLATGVLAVGCGVRLETPPPTEPSPDAVEVLRAGAVDDALAVADLVADVTPGVTDPATLAALEEAAAFAEQHADALGGVYDSGLDDLDLPTGDPTTTAPADDPDEPADDAAGTDEDRAEEDGTTEGPGDGTATTDDVVVALVEAAQRTGASADAATDAGLARLLASVAASEHVSARRLAALTGSAAADELVTTVPPVEEAPAGIGAADLATLVETEDAAGYAYEVRAAQSEDDARTAAVARAAEHRARGQAWALAAGTDGTAQDPRRVAYVLPDDADVATLARQVESGLAQTYASLVATAAPTSRAEAVALLVDSWASAVAWGETPVAFPGLPEQSAG
ncbi:DUF4439 domain-containing protein [Cellulosimicrobium cellulans]|uniref:DUF4439 domain-containing protein n=1 Tax=Cellulosimicrobium cellulans TaxID=1710 RepID=UPI001EDC328F|nr:DUF4439 domain-containing protein [Cellulosimicrobium cellulans]UKJ64464.1 DUF4439 domain-containing protein [Cellulosimicrobium cellulans]